jgi:hypothetical protein
MKGLADVSPFCCAPGTGAILKVEVLPQADYSERSEAQLHEGDNGRKEAA